MHYTFIVFIVFSPQFSPPLPVKVLTHIIQKYIKEITQTHPNYFNDLTVKHYELVDFTTSISLKWHINIIKDNIISVYGNCSMDSVFIFCTFRFIFSPFSLTWGISKINFEHPKMLCMHISSEIITNHSNDVWWIQQISPYTDYTKYQSLYFSL